MPEVSVGQPFALGIWSGLLRLMGDGDDGLPEILEGGVPTRMFEPILPCVMYPPEDRDNKLSDTSQMSLQGFWSNWKSAEEEQKKVVALLKAEVLQGWVGRLEGSWEEDVSKPWDDRAA